MRVDLDQTELSQAWHLRFASIFSRKKVALGLRERISSLALSIFCLAHTLYSSDRAVWWHACLELWRRALTGSYYQRVHPLAPAPLEPKVELSSPSQIPERSTPSSAASVEPQASNSVDNSEFLDQQQAWLKDGHWVRSRLAPLVQPFALALDTRQGDLVEHLKFALKDLEKVRSGKSYLNQQIDLELAPSEFRYRVMSTLLARVLKSYTMNQRELSLEQAEALAKLSLFIFEQMSITSNRKDTRRVVQQLLEQYSGKLLAWHQADPSQFSAKLKQLFEEVRAQCAQNPDPSTQARERYLKEEAWLQGYRVSGNYLLEFSQDEARYDGAIAGRGVCFASCLRWIHTTSILDPTASVRECFDKMGGKEAIFCHKDLFNQSLYQCGVLLDGNWVGDAPPELLRRYRLKGGPSQLLTLGGADRLDCDRIRVQIESTQGLSAFLLGLSGNGGHVTLIQRRREGDRELLLFYDPNFGVFGFEQFSELALFLKDFLKLFYGDMPKIWGTSYRALG